MIEHLLAGSRKLRAAWTATSTWSRPAERGQALPAAVAALAVGALLITPMLRGASVDSRFTDLVGIKARERYSMDAGIEWSGWRLLSNPALTTDTSFNAAPLQPFPASVNDDSFPATQIRFVPDAGAVEAQHPAWQAGGGDHCYAFSASDAGTLSVRVNVDSGQVWIALLPVGAPCVRPPGLNSVWVGPPYGADFDLADAGAYQLLVGVDTATTGDLSLSVPAATYEVTSSIGDRNVTAQFVAGYSGVKVASWQLN